jgi:hypothetical protein
MPNDDSPDFKPWNVKDLPVAIRSQITDLAARQGVTVAEWLTEYFTLHGLDGQDLPAIPRRDRPANRDTDTLDRVIDRACRLAQHTASMPKAVADLAYGLVKAELRDLRAEAPVLPRLPSGKFARLEPSETRTETAEIGA